MTRTGGSMRVVALLAGLMAGRVVAADWGEPAGGGFPVASLSAVSAATLSSDRVLLAGLRSEAGSPRVYLARSEQGSWSAANGGLPADGEAPSGQVRAPVLAAGDGGSAYLVFARHDGVSAWRIQGRLFDGVALSDLDEGRPADAEVPGGTVGAFAATGVDGGELHVLYTQFDGSRMALRASWVAGGNWQQANDGMPLDLGGSGWADAPAVARDGQGGAVAAYTQETAAGRRLFALRLTGSWLGRTWERLDGGAPVDRSDLGHVAAPAVAAMPDGRVLIAYLQEDGAGIPRLYAVVHNGEAWTRLNGGQPIDAHPAGVEKVAVVSTNSGSVLIAYATIDAVNGEEPPRLHSLEVLGLVVSTMNGGAALEAAGGGLAGIALTAGCLLFEQPVGAVYARALAAVALVPAGSAATAPATVPGPVDGLRVSGAVFRPGLGERVGLAWTAATAQRVRVIIQSISGESVIVLADGTTAGRTAVEWDGRDAEGRGVAPGVYVVRASGETFRQLAKLVVVR